MRSITCLTLPVLLLFGCGSPQTHATTATTTPETPASTEAESSEATPSTEADPNDPRSVLEDRAERNEARELGLSIIQSYFDGDPSVFVELVAETVPQIGREGEAMDGQYFRDMVAHVDPYPSGEDLSMYSMDEYHDVFDPLVVTYDEAVEHFGFPPVENDGWIPESSDFIYFGGFLHLDKVEADKFIRDGLNSFVFGKRDGVWKFVGFVS